MPAKVKEDARRCAAGHDGQGDVVAIWAIRASNHGVVHVPAVCQICRRRETYPGDRRSGIRSARAELRLSRSRPDIGSRGLIDSDRNGEIVTASGIRPSDTSRCAPIIAKGADQTRINALGQIAEQRSDIDATVIVTGVRVTACRVVEVESARISGVMDVAVADRDLVSLSNLQEGRGEGRKYIVPSVGIAEIDCLSGAGRASETLYGADRATSVRQGNGPVGARIVVEVARVAICVGERRKSKQRESDEHRGSIHRNSSDCLNGASKSKPLSIVGTRKCAAQ